MRTILLLQHFFIFALAAVPCLLGILAAKYYMRKEWKTSILFFCAGVAICIVLVFLGMHAAKNNWHSVKLLSIFFPNSII
jgi:cytochrome c biogenesis protein CcdA